MFLHCWRECKLIQPLSSVHGIFQARVLEWGAIAFSKVTLTHCNHPKVTVHLGVHPWCCMFCRAQKTPPEKRDVTVYGETFVVRPHFIQLNRCSGARLEGFRLRYSPFWFVEIFKSSDVVCRGVSVFGMFGNSDAFDVDFRASALTVSNVWNVLPLHLHSACSSSCGSQVLLS